MRSRFRVRPLLLGMLVLAALLLPAGIGPVVAAAAATAPAALPNYTFDVRYDRPTSRAGAPVKDVALTYGLDQAQQPAKGNVTVATVPKSGYNEFTFTYTPVAGARGEDSFHIKATASDVELSFRVLLTLVGPVKVDQPAFSADAGGTRPVTGLTAGQPIHLSFPVKNRWDDRPVTVAVRATTSSAADALATEVATIAAGGTSTFTLGFTPDARVASDGVEVTFTDSGTAQALGDPIRFPTAMTSFTAHGNTVYHMTKGRYVANNTAGTQLVAASYDGKISTYFLDGRDGHRRWEVKNTATTEGGQFPNALKTFDIDDDGADEIFVASGDGNLYAYDSNLILKWTFPSGSYGLGQAPLLSMAFLRNADGNHTVVTAGMQLRLYQLRGSDGQLMHTSETSLPVKLLEAGQTKAGTTYLAAVLLGRYVDTLARFTVTAHPTAPHKVLTQRPALKVTPRYPDGSSMITSLLVDRPAPGKITVDQTVPKAYGQLQVFDAMTGADETGPDSSYQTVLGDHGAEPVMYAMSRYSYVDRGDDTQDLFLGVAGGQLFAHRAKDGTFVAAPAAPMSFTGGFYDESSNDYYLGGEMSGDDQIYVLDLDRPDWAYGFAIARPVPGSRYDKVRRNLDTIRSQIANFGTAGYTRPSYQPDTGALFTLDSTYDPSKEISDPEDLEKNRETARKAPRSDTVRTYRGTGAQVAQQFTWKEAFPRTEYLESPAMKPNAALGIGGAEAVRAKLAQHPDRRVPADDSLEKILGAAEAFEYEQLDFSLWCGHGNDVFWLKLTTITTILEKAPTTFRGCVYSEFEGTGDAAAYVVDKGVIEVAKIFQAHRASHKEIPEHRQPIILLRNKNAHWFTSVYQDYAHLIDEFAQDYRHIIIPAMEETNSRMQDLSLEARMGLWLSGRFARWGDRMVDDNASYVRYFEWSAQSSNSHHHRNLVMKLSLGATAFDLMPDADPVLDMVRKGILQVPARDQVMSVSPRLSLAMTYTPKELTGLPFTTYTPSDRLLEQVAATNDYASFDKYTHGDYTPVFDRLGQIWGGSPTAPKGFSALANGSERRMTDFLPRYPNGIIPIVPGDAPDTPVLGDTRIWTDGHHYYSDPNQNQQWVSEEYEPTLTGLLESSRAALPISVSAPDNGVAWTATKLVSYPGGAPRVIRLVLVDRGYVNPDDRVATVRLNLPGSTLKIKSATDLINPAKPVLTDANKSVDDHLDASGTTLADLEVPAGGWRIIDLSVGP